MTANLLRDASSMPALAELLKEVSHYLAAVRAILAEGWMPHEAQSALTLAALGHALDFETWRSLVRRQELTADDAVEVMVRFVRCLTHGEAGEIEPRVAD